MYVEMGEGELAFFGGSHIRSKVEFGFDFVTSWDFCVSASTTSNVRCTMGFEYNDLNGSSWQ